MGSKMDSRLGTATGGMIRTEKQCGILQSICCKYINSPYDGFLLVLFS